MEHSATPCFQEPSLLAFTEGSGRDDKLFPVRLFLHSAIVPLAKIDTPDAVSKVSFSQEFRLSMALMLLLMFLEPVEGCQLDKPVMLYECHLLKIMFRFDLFRAPL